MENIVFNSKGKGLLFGPELEFFTVDDCFRPVNLHSEFKKSSLYNKHIHPELCNEQIEISVGPSNLLQELEERLYSIIEKVNLICKKQRALLLSSSIHQGPFTLFNNSRYHSLLEYFGRETFSYAGICSDQINIGAGSEAEAIKIYNLIRSYLPIITGFSASSPPLEQRGFQSDKMCRLQFLENLMGNRPEFTSYPAQFKSLRDFEKDRNSSEVYRLFQTNFRLLRMKPEYGVAAEIRTLDKQPSLKEYLALVGLCKGLLLYGKPLKNRNLEKDFLLARKEGIFDKKLFRRVLDVVCEHLPNSEKHYLDPLYWRLKKGTVADAMLKKRNAGTTKTEIFQRFITSLEENEIFA